MTLPHRFEAARPPWQPGGALSGPCVLVFPSSFRRKFSQNHQGDGELRPLGVFVKGSIQAVPLVSDPGCPERFRAELKINAHGPKPPRSQSRERSGPQARGASGHAEAKTVERSRAIRFQCTQPLTPAGILPNSGAPFAAPYPNARRRARHAKGTIRAASGAGRRPAGASGQSRERGGPQARRSTPRPKRWSGAGPSGFSAPNRSLRPEFCRIPAPRSRLRTPTPAGAHVTLKARSEPRAGRAAGPPERAVTCGG
jgi:hypothetical protein